MGRLDLINGLHREQVGATPLAVAFLLGRKAVERHIATRAGNQETPPAATAVLGRLTWRDRPVEELVKRPLGVVPVLAPARSVYAHGHWHDEPRLLRHHEIHTGKIDLFTTVRTDEVNLSTTGRPALKDRVPWFDTSHRPCESVTAMRAGYATRL